MSNNINNMTLLNTETDKAIAALSQALRAISPEAAAIIMSVAANAAREFANTKDGYDATHEAQRLATALMRQDT